MSTRPRADPGALNEERLVLRFGVGSPEHALPTATLGLLLTRFQKALTYTGWALLSGPGIDGDPPARIERSTSTQVLALAPGSFEVPLSPQTLELPTESEGQDVLDKAISVVLDLAKAASTDTFGDEVEARAEELGRQPSRRLSLWFKKLAEHDLDTAFEWSSRPDLGVRVTSEQAGALSRWLSDVQERFSEITVTGTLAAADALKGRFAIVDDTEGEYAGKVASELLDREVIGKRYRANLQVRTLRSARTGVTRDSYTLLGLEPA